VDAAAREQLRREVQAATLQMQANKAMEVEMLEEQLQRLRSENEGLKQRIDSLMQQVTKAGEEASLVMGVLSSLWKWGRMCHRERLAPGPVMATDAEVAVLYGTIRASRQGVFRAARHFSQQKVKSMRAKTWVKKLAILSKISGECQAALGCQELLCVTALGAPLPSMWARPKACR
jgi:hypothetical protein